MLIKVSAIAFLLVLAASAQEFRVGGKVDDFAVRDTSGETVHLSAIRGEVTVVMFLSTRCLVSNSYNERIRTLSRDYAAKKVKFVGLNANRAETLSDIAEHTSRQRFEFSVYKDVNNVVADRFGAEVTPEIYVIDAAGVIRYRGPIDDAENPDRVTTHHMRTALDAILSGKDAGRPTTEAFGCKISRRLRRDGL